MGNLSIKSKRSIKYRICPRWRLGADVGGCPRPRCEEKYYLAQVVIISGHRSNSIEDVGQYGFTMIEYRVIIRELKRDTGVAWLRSV